MSEQDRLQRFLAKHPHHHKTFFSRPYVSRRQFFEIVGAGITGSFLLPHICQAHQSAETSSSAVTQNTAKNVIFILLAGAISHTDTFDLKVVPGVTPSNFNPTMISGV